MQHTEITVTTNTAHSELVAYFLQERCYDGVCIIDQNDLSVANWDYIDDSVIQGYSDQVYVKGYCSIEDTDSVLLYLHEQLTAIYEGSWDIVTNRVEDTDWVANWKKNFAPIDFGSIVVCPEWQSVDSALPVLYLDNGVAFGTGQHETTSMCIQLLSHIDLVGHTVLDVGCGSGILGLSSILLGAQHATMVDVDSMCCDTALANANTNHLSDKCTVLCGNLCEQVSGTYDILLANLTADILYLLSGDIAKVVHRGSQIILSGILSDRVHKVIACYEKIGCTLVCQLQDGEWSALHMEYDV